MEKARKKLTDRSGETKIRSVWKCRCKIGTTSSNIAYFFEKPETGKIIEYVEDIGKTTAYNCSEDAMIDEVREDGFVFCSKF